MTDESLNQDPGADTARLQTPDANSPGSEQASVESDWQRRLLPFLVGTLIVLTILFCAAIAWETRTIQNRMEGALDIDLHTLANTEFRTNGAFLLEANLIERRYREANVAALSRVYLIFLGFATGMVMALVGSTFILGKFSEPQTSIDGGGSSFKASLRSGSPGVILAFFGTVLMLSTIFSKTEISVSDRAVYVGGGSTEGTTPETEAAAKTPGPDIPDSKGLVAGAKTTAPAAQTAAQARKDASPAGLQLAMASGPTLKGRYSLEAIAGAGTLSIQGNQVQFTGSDGKRIQVKVRGIDDSHVTFSILDSNGGHQDFDGFLTSPHDDIVGRTSYHGSYSTHPYGFVATRISEK